MIQLYIQCTFLLSNHHVIPEFKDINGLNTSPNEKSSSKESAVSAIVLKSNQQRHEQKK